MRHRVVCNFSTVMQISRTSKLVLVAILPYPPPSLCIHASGLRSQRVREPLSRSYLDCCPSRGDGTMCPALMTCREDTLQHSTQQKEKVLKQYHKKVATQQSNGRKRGPSPIWQGSQGGCSIVTRPIVEASVEVTKWQVGDQPGHRCQESFPCSDEPDPHAGNCCLGSQPGSITSWLWDLQQDPLLLFASIS